MMIFWILFSIVILSVLAQDKQNLSEMALKLKKLPSIDTCGKSANDPFGKKIFDGSPADLGAYPWMAAIGYTLKGEGPLWNCGGALITDQYVITAAHCIVTEEITIYGPYAVSVVRLGDLDLNETVKDGATPLDIPVEQIIPHERYNNSMKINDIGLLKLKLKVQFDDYIRPLCLPLPDFYNNTFVNKVAIVAGWGATDFDENAPKITHLMEAEVEVKDVNECRKNITSVYPGTVLDKSVMCAASPGKDSCQGDSGGPLMLFRRYKDHARLFLLGIVSYGYGCAEEGYPGVYTRVSEHMHWIIKNLDLKSL